MVRVVATFVLVWLAIGALGVLAQGITPIPNTAISLFGLVIAAVAAFWVYRRRPVH